MENKDKNIDAYFRKLSENKAPESFPNKDAVWDRVENKLNEHKKRKIIPIWKYAGIAASLLLFISIGGWLIIHLSEQQNNELPTPHKVVLDEQKAKQILQEKEAEEIYAYEETDTMSDSASEKVCDLPKVKKTKNTSDKMFTSVKTKSNTEVKRAATTQEDFNENLTSGKQDRETDKNADFKSNGVQTGSAEKGSKGSGTAGRYDDTYETRGSYRNSDYKSYNFQSTGSETISHSNRGVENTYMDEVVVDVYRTTGTPKSAMASATVTSKTIEGRPNASFMQTLQGQVPGLNISTGTKFSRFLSKLKPDFKKKKANKDEKTIDDTIIQKEIPKQMLPIKVDSESYESFKEHSFQGAVNQPVSTFSIDVDNTSYSNIRRFLNQGRTVPKDAVRIEEMMNYFHYDYAAPKASDQHPFAIHTEYGESPWNKEHSLLRIGIKGKEIEDRVLPKSNFVFLVDLSGSMNQSNKLPLLQASMKVLLNELRDDDHIAIVYYASGTGVLLEPTKASEKKKILDVIDNMRAGGGTSGAAGIDLAYQMAEKHFVKGGNNRIILATDGDFNIGKSSDSEMQTLIEEKRKSGVFLTCLGFGMGNYKDSKLMTLSKKGNGNYAYIDNMQEAKRYLSKEFKGSMYAIAKDVKIQIEFNPKHVQAYRLIGYEMRKLRNEDFTNDAIDAGELGSGHTVTALYEIIPSGVKSTFFTPEKELKYGNKVINETYPNELATVKFRYKKPDGDTSTEMVQPIENKQIKLEKTSKDFKFASAVAWFGLKLRDSEWIKNKSTKDIIELAKDGIHKDRDGYKSEFVRLVELVE